MPVPAPAEPWYEDWTSMSTSASSTFAAIACGSEGPPVALLLDPEAPEPPPKLPEPPELPAPPELPVPPELPGPPKPPPGKKAPGVEPPADAAGCCPVVQRECPTTAPPTAARPTKTAAAAAAE